MAIEPEPPPHSDDTAAHIAMAGIDERKRRVRRLVLILAAVVAVVAAVIGLDLLGVIRIPGVGLRGIAGIEPRPEAEDEDTAKTKSSTSASQRARMRNQLMGGGQRSGQSKMNAAERRMTAEIFNSDEKQDIAQPTVRVQEPLPGAVPREALLEVIAGNSAAMANCVGQASRRGENLTGKMAMELTITPRGAVSDVRVTSTRFSGSLVADCISLRARGWRFPAFTGEPITVTYPYVIGGGL